MVFKFFDKKLVSRSDNKSMSNYLQLANELAKEEKYIHHLKTKFRVLIKLRRD